MKENQGSISVMSLIVMAIILVFSLYLMYVFSLEYMIVNSILNSIQSSYFSESKIYLVLNDENYYNEIMPYVVKFIKDIYNTNMRNIRIELNENDLLEGDSDNLVIANIFHDYDGRIILELNTKTTYKKITKQAIAKVTLIKEFFELGLPVIATDTLEKPLNHEFHEYMKYLEKNIEIYNLDNNINSFDFRDFETVKLKKNGDKFIIECHRNNTKKPIIMETFVGNTIFLISKEGIKSTEISIINTTPENSFKLSGIIYAEGDFVVKNDFEFDGILIINGNLIVDPLSTMKVKGILLYNNDIDSIKNSNVQVEYDIGEIRKYGIYLSGFISFDIRNIKIN